MSSASNIQWTNATWNPLAGCTRVSSGCDFCYAAALAAGRLRATPTYKGLATVTPAGRAAFTGRIRLLPDRLDDPLRWRAPRRVFVNSMSDLFHDDVPDDYIARVFAVMARAPRHTFQVLTKRAARMHDYVRSHGFVQPLAHIWLGVSAEDQATADERLPLLLQTPAAVRWLSAEPLLGPLDLRPYLEPSGLQWVVAGGESGPRARPLQLAWVRAIRDACAAAGVPFFFKQVGGRTPKAGGDQLDGRSHHAYPLPQRSHA